MTLPGVRGREAVMQALRDHVRERERESRERAALRASDPASASVRFGELPEGERSELLGPALDPAGGVHSLYQPGFGREMGVSVFPARELASGELVIDTGGGRNESLRLGFAAYFFEMPPAARRIYRVYGDEIGTGGTGEPLLRNCTAIEVPLTTAVVIDSWGTGLRAGGFGAFGVGGARLVKLEHAINLWRHLDGTREGYRTPYLSENCLEAFAPPGAREVLHEANDRKWRRKRRTGR